jgi:hypothetical protein
MFNSNNLWVMLTGVFVALGTILFSIYFVNKKIFIEDTKEILVKFILLVFTALVSLFIIDKVIAFNVKLLSDEMNHQLFELIKTLILMIFSYYFGTKKAVEKNN